MAFVLGFAGSFLSWILLITVVSLTWEILLRVLALLFLLLLLLLFFSVHITS